MTRDEFDDFVNKVDNMTEGYLTNNFYIGDFLTMDNFKTYEHFVLKPLNIIIVKNGEDDLYTIDWVGNDKPIVISTDEFMSRLETVKNNIGYVLTLDANKG